MAVSPDGTMAVNTTETSNFYIGLIQKQKQIVHNTLVDQRPRHMSFRKKKMEISFGLKSEIGGTVMVVDSNTKESIGKITFKIDGIFKDLIQPVGIKLTSDGKYAFIALGPANHVAVVDAKTFKVIKYLLVGKKSLAVGFLQMMRKNFIQQMV